MYFYGVNRRDLCLNCIMQRKLLILKKTAILLVLLLAFKTSVCQQKPVQKKATVSLSDTARLANLIRDARAMMKATTLGDFSVLAKYTHPLVVQSMGGADKMAAYLTKEFRNMQAQGIKFDEAQIGTPSKFVYTGGEYFCVIPQKVIMVNGSRRIASASSLLGVSNNGGNTWRFVDAGGMTDEQVKQYFPKIYGKLTIPKRSEAKEVTE